MDVTRVCNEKRKINLPTLLVCSHYQKDKKTCDNLTEYLRKERGLTSITSTNEFLPGSNYSENIQKSLKSVKKVVIILSEESNRNEEYEKIIQAIMRCRYSEGKAFDIVPMLDADADETNIPFMMTEIPFIANQGEEDKLVKSLYQLFCKPSDYKDNKDFQEMIVNSISNLDRYLWITKRSVKENMTDNLKQIGMHIMSDWGVSVKGEYLYLNINTLQLAAAKQHILLKDMFKTIFADKPLRILRAFAVKRINFESFITSSPVYDDLVSVIQMLLERYTRSGEYKYLYIYRRNGLKSTDESENVFKPIVTAKSNFNGDKPHMPEYESYNSRLETFSNFPIQASLVHSNLAKAGYFSVGKLDYVQCYYCGHCVKIFNAREEHQQYYYIKCRLYQTKVNLAKEISSPAVRKYMDKFGFRNINVRISTFEPLIERGHDKKHLIEFAQAGFHYLGTKEDIMCYECCLGLTSISTDRKPWNLHLKLSPNCPHLNAISTEMRKKLDKENETESESEEDFVEIELLLHNKYLT